MPPESLPQNIIDALAAAQDQLNTAKADADEANSAVAAAAAAQNAADNAKAASTAQLQKSHDDLAMAAATAQTAVALIMSHFNVPQSPSAGA